MTAAIVLAGGRSRRFGGDKLKARLADGRSVLAHAVAGAAAVADEVVVVIASGADRPDGLPGSVVLVHDPEPDGGPLMGLAAGLETVSGEIVLVVGGDMPALEPSVLRHAHRRGREGPRRMTARGWRSGIRRGHRCCRASCAGRRPGEPAARRWPRAIDACAERWKGWR